MTSVNFNDLIKAAGDAGGGEPLPNGTYSAVVDSASSKPTSTGKESIAVQFKIEDGPYAGRPIWNNFVLSPDQPNALAFFFRHMANLGLSSQYFEANPALERVAADLIGRRCRITLSTREWQGQSRNQVDTVLTPLNGSGPSIPPPPAAGTPGIPTVSPSPVTALRTASPALAVPGVPAVPSTTPAPSAYEQATGTAPAITPTAVTPPPPPADDDLPF
jgi:Protein of unknown function (DUF669)